MKKKTIEKEMGGSFNVRSPLKGKNFSETIENICGFLFSKEFFEPNQTSLTLLKENNSKDTLKHYIQFLVHPIKKPGQFGEMEERFHKEKSKRSLFKKMLTPLTIVGMIILVSISFFAIFAPWVAPYSYIDVSLNRHIGSFLPPSSEHLLGTTILGRDVLSRLIYGSRESLTAGLGAIVIGYGFGILFGIISAYFGGWVDTIIMRIFDLVYAFPGLILAMTIIAVLGRSMENILLAFGLLNVPQTARLMRGSVLQVKNNLYIQAAQTSGAKDFKVMFKHILPNAISPIIVSISFAMGGVILGIAGLTFIGLGEPDIVEWGFDVNAARSHLFTAPWAVLWPGFIIALTTLGFILIGDGLRDALDPRNNT